MNKEEFILYAKKLNIGITEDLYYKFDLYYKLLVEWNNKFNLTHIILEKEVFLNHFYDSICLTKGFDFEKNISLCDFGTGAGFPGMVIAILFGHIKVTLLESNGKKCSFLEEVKNKLNLKNVSVINIRVEDYARKVREEFDIVTCRAVSSLPILLELSASLIKENGYLLPLKSNVDEELKLSFDISKKLGLEYIKTIKYNLPINDAYRTIPVYKKTSKTDIKYPRSYNLIVKKYKNK